MWKFLMAYLCSQSGQVPADDLGDPNEREDQNTETQETQDDSTGLRQPYDSPSTDENQEVPNSNQQTQQDTQSADFTEGLNLDPKTFSPENQAIFKKMQAAYTKRMQGAAELQNKAQMVDQFYSDKNFARQTLLAWAAQEGYQLSPINSPAQPQQTQVNQPQGRPPQELVELLKQNLDPSLHWMAEGQAAAMQQVMAKLLDPVFKATEAQKEQQATQRQQQVDAEWDRLAGEFSERQPGWEAHEGAMSQMLDFLAGPNMTHPQFGSKFDLLHQLVTSKGAALVEATNRVNRAAKNATPTQTNGRRTVNSKPIQDEVAETSSSDDAFRKASQFALQNARRRK